MPSSMSTDVAVRNEVLNEFAAIECSTLTGALPSGPEGLCMSALGSSVSACSWMPVLPWDLQGAAISGALFSAIQQGVQFPVLLG